jgi:hypothetical protein
VVAALGVISWVDRATSLRNCATSARSRRAREHSVAAARALATARSLLATAHRQTLLTDITSQTVVNYSTFAKRVTIEHFR